MNTTIGLVDTLICDTLKAIALPVSAGDSDASAARSFLSWSGLTFPAVTTEENRKLFRALATLAVDSLQSTGIFTNYNNAIPIMELNRLKNNLTTRYRIASNIIPLISVNSLMVPNGEGSIGFQHTLGVTSLSVIGSHPQHYEGIFESGNNEFQVVVGQAVTDLVIPEYVVSAQFRWGRLTRVINIRNDPVSEDVSGNVRVSMAVGGQNVAQNAWRTVFAGETIRFTKTAAQPERRVFSAEFRSVVIYNDANSNICMKSPEDITTLAYITNLDGQVHQEIQAFMNCMNRAFSQDGNAVAATFELLPQQSRRFWLMIYRDILILGRQLRFD